MVNLLRSRVNTHSAQHEQATYSSANGVSKPKQDDLSNDKSCCTQNNVAERPPILQGTHNEHKLRHNICHHADSRPYKVHDP